MINVLSKDVLYSVMASILLLPVSRMERMNMALIGMVLVQLAKKGG